MKGSKAGFVCFLLLFMGFIFSSSASRDFKSMKRGVAVQEIHLQDQIGMMRPGESMEFDGSATRRMNLEVETMDYGGTGPNDKHDPPSPGKL